MKMRGFSLSAAAATAVLGFMVTGMADAATVKITPLGSHEGEFCSFDRAMVFESATGISRRLGPAPAAGRTSPPWHCPTRCR